MDRRKKASSGWKGLEDQRKYGAAIDEVKKAQDKIRALLAGEEPK